MAGPSCAGDASFHRSFDSDSDDDFFGFSTSDLEESRQRIRQGNWGELLTFIRDSDDEDGVDLEVHDRTSEVESSDGQPSDDDDSSGESAPAQQWSSANLVDPPDVPFVDANIVGVDNAEQCTPMTAVQLFGLFFTDYLLRLIVTETNRYAGQSMETPSTRGRKPMAWHDLTMPELKTWLCLMITMGVVEKKGRLGEYWSNHWLTQTPAFCETMPKTRFLQNLRFIQFVDNRDASNDKSNKMWKIQPVLDYLNKRFRSTYHTRRELSIDETMIKFKGRLSIKIKPVKWGIKIFTLAEAKTGYVLNLLPYVGKRVDTDVGKTTQTVLYVGKHHLGRGHRFFTDNYYTSVELMTKLQEAKTLSCGIVNSNRIGLPQDMKKTNAVVKKLKRGESLKRMKGRMLAVTWKDTLVLNLLCNVPGCLGDADVRRRDKKNGGVEITVSRPRAIEMYNDFMGGVDLSDQRVSTYRRHVKSLTWYLQVFFHITHLSCEQAYLLHRELHPESKKSQLNFFLELIDGLVAGRTFVKKAGRSSSAPPPTDVRFNRNLEHAPFKHDTQSKCVVHSRRVDTVYGCNVCKVRMCPYPMLPPVSLHGGLHV